MAEMEEGHLPAWMEIWRTVNGTDVCDEYLNTLHRYATEKNNKDVQDVDAAFDYHTMRSVLTNCRPHRCLANNDGDDCYCRYNINTCERGRISVVYKHGVHVMHDIQATSPPRTRLTRPMKTIIEAKLDLFPSASTQQLYAHISSVIERNDLKGPAPLETQVNSFLRHWRRNHPGHDTSQVSEIVDTSLYDVFGLSDATPTWVVFFRDAVFSQDRWVSRVGVGTADDPLRVGLTCYKLLHDYAQVQRAYSLTTLINLESTFNTVA
ncbi:hypothetical protein F443_18507 [Phytophthora nicotianae P1569]|uniref:Uncharacterized protein n=1 Tax=Phytophthora nicotianae P1569 TaxID=1317065 RepID=V9E7P4_PHYNI|nr:hypothetical protein F443_18507 [Phytophthora nicotianae P1569]